MNKNDVFEIEITGMTDDGSGVGRAEGIAVLFRIQSSVKRSEFT